MIEREHNRILIFNDGLELGGTEKLLINLLVHLVDEKWKVTLVLPFRSEANILLTEIPESVRIIYFFEKEKLGFRKKWNEVRMIFSTKSFLKQCQIKENEYDRVICFKEGFFAKVFSEFSIPKILWIHNILYRRQYETKSFKERISVWLNKKQLAVVEKSYSLYNQVVCVSQACENSYTDIIQSRYPSDQEVKVIPNAIDPEKIRLLAKEQAPIEMPHEVTNFILLTRLSPDKRVDRIVEVAKKMLYEGYSKFHIHLLGVDVNDVWLNDELKKHTLQSYITIHGKILNPYPYIKQSDWLLCVSERESFSLVLLEAMSLGVPVLTTDCGGPAEIVSFGKYGILVDNCTDAIFVGMKRILDEVELKKNYQKELNIAVSNYQYDRWFKAVDDLLEA